MPGASLVLLVAIGALAGVLSGLFGIGGGWNVEEMENHGTEYKSRWRLLRAKYLLYR